MPPHNPLNRLAEHYLGAEFLLAQADLGASRNYRAAVQLRAQAAEHVCAGLSAMIDNHDMAVAISNRIDDARQPEALPADRSKFVEIESALLHLAGLPLDRAVDLVHEAWYAHWTAPPAALVSGVQFMARARMIRDLVCQAPDAFLARLDGPPAEDPVPLRRPSPTEPPLRRAWWHKLASRRALYVVGGVLVTATNVVGAAVLEAAAGRRWDGR